MPLVLALLPGCVYQRSRTLPSGLSQRSALLPAGDVRFLRDLTEQDASGVQQTDQQIFDEVFNLINHAEHLIVVDMFLFNTFGNAKHPPHRQLCEELTSALMARKTVVPSLQAVLITDPVNTVYGGLRADHLHRLEQAGVQVVITDLDVLRDSNPAWSSLWRVFFWPWGNTSWGGWLASPFGEGRVSLRSWLALLNFKANHRKVVIADQQGELWALVTSANPHDGSSAHTNVGVLFNGEAAQALLSSEKAVLAFSAPDVSIPVFSSSIPLPEDPRVSVQVLTEGAIAEAAERLIHESVAGDTVDLVMFYLADRQIIRALIDATKRGVQVRAVLDPNKDAFGRLKNGMPNRQTASELVDAGVQVRWADTHGEQMHAKLLLCSSTSGRITLLLGSANFTRRNLRKYNLETNVLIIGEPQTPALIDASRFVATFWENKNTCRRYTTGYETYHDPSRWRVFRYRIQEATGLCTW